MEKDWVVIYKAEKLYKVELLKHHLDDANIKTVIMNKIDSSYSGLTLENSYVALLKVRKEDETKARKILRQYL